MIIAAFDPGLSGAVAVTGAQTTNSVYDLPTMGAGKQVILNGTALADILARVQVKHVVIEHVASMPKQGVASTFKFGTAFGQIIGVVQALGLSHEFVRPNVWKKALGLSSDKEAARRRAIELFPGLAVELARKKDHNRAEALLLARWWWEARG